jgi:hypothetical protein
VAGAEIHLDAKAGSSQTGPSVRTDSHGRAKVVWQPQVKDLTAGLQTKDQVTDYHTEFNYIIKAKGFAPTLGRVRRLSRASKVATESLASMGHEADFRPMHETVLLRKLSELLAGELGGKGAGGRLAARCLAFRRDNNLITERLEAPFAWPAFRLKKGVLAVRFEWQPASRPGNLGPEELAGLMMRNSGLPLAILCGQELLPLAGVRQLNLEFTFEQTPPDDPYALPQRRALIISAPAADYVALAQGRLDPDAFAAKYSGRLKNLGS